MKYTPLEEFYEERLADTEEAPAEEMGVVSVKGRIGGYLTDDYRKSETFADIQKRRDKVVKLLAKYT
jgi:hypothetical protein